MKTIHYSIFVLLLFAFGHLSFSQNDSDETLRFEVNRIQPAISITKSQLSKATTIADLNPHYQSSWVKEYISVEILTIYKGRSQKSSGKSALLNQRQRDIMQMADLGTAINISVQYIPDNTLSHNDIKEINFSFVVTPANEANYFGGQQKLRQYLKNVAIDKIIAADFIKSHQYNLAAVKFTVNKKGQIVDSHVFQTSGNKKTDARLLEAVKNMQDWKAAEYSNGVKVNQEFVLTVGNHKSCVINLLNIRLKD